MNKLSLLALLLLANLSISYAQVPTGGLTASYLFSGNANDGSGNGHNGVQANCTLTGDRFGISSQAYAFNGSTSKIDISSFHPSVNNFSFSLWFNKPSFGTSSSTYEVLFSDAGFYQGTRVYLNKDSLYFEIQQGSTPNAPPGQVRDVSIPATSFMTGVWYNIVGISNSGALSIYLNGVLQQMSTGYLGDNGSAAGFGIGYESWQNTGYFNGTLDDIRIYNRALGKNEIFALVTEGGFGPVPTSGLSALYLFSGYANDGSGNGHNGVQANCTLTGDRFGISSQAYAFNGSTSKIDISSFHPSVNNFSFSLWFNKPSFGTSSSTYEVLFSDAGFYQGTRVYLNKDSLYFEIQQGSTPNAPPGQVRDVSIPATSFKTGVWYNIVGISNNGTLSIYLNGIPKQTRTDYLGDNGSAAGFGIGYESWQNTGYFNGTLDDIRIYSRALTGQEIFPLYTEQAFGITTKIVNSNNLPNGYQISQNYPNPFNPTTMINYSVPKASLVTIKVYDILGREVETLVNEQKNVGNYNVQFNASRLASGIYFYRMQAGEFVQTRKLILMK